MLEYHFQVVIYFYFFQEERLSKTRRLKFEENKRGAIAFMKEKCKKRRKEIEILLLARADDREDKKWLLKSTFLLSHYEPTYYRQSV